MPSDLERIARELEIHRQRDETETEFRFRVAIAYLEADGGAFEAAQLITNKDPNDFSEEENLLAFQLNFSKAQHNRKKYSRQKDTYSQMQWNDLEKLLPEHGFSKAHSYTFENPLQPSTETYSIWVEQKNALLLTTESYTPRVNSIKLYYEHTVSKNEDDFSRMIRQDTLKKASSNFRDDPTDTSSDICIITFDAREGLIEHLQKLKKSGLKTNSPWKNFDEHRLWLCDYSETKNHYKNPDYFETLATYNQIMHKKMQQLPPYIQKIIGYHPPQP